MPDCGQGALAASDTRAVVEGGKGYSGGNRKVSKPLSRLVMLTGDCRNEKGEGGGGRGGMMGKGMMTKRRETRSNIAPRPREAQSGLVDGVPPLPHRKIRASLLGVGETAR